MYASPDVSKLCLNKQNISVHSVTQFGLQQLLVQFELQQLLVQLCGTNGLLPNFVRVGGIQKKHKAMRQDFDESMIIEVRSRSIHFFLYTSDAADDLLCVDIGGRTMHNKNSHTKKQTSLRNILQYISKKANNTHTIV